MAGPPGFADLINRKYSILQQEATDRGALQQAQAEQISASTPFENALRAAQTRQTSETAKTIAPLAQAAQAATYAGIGETQARTGLTGAQTGLVGAQTRDINADLGSLGVLGARYYMDQLQRMGTTFKPGAATGTQNQTSVLDRSSSLGAPTATPGVPVSPPPASKITMGQGQAGYYDDNGNYVLGLAKGTSKVMPAKSPGKAAGGKVMVGPPPGAMMGGIGLGAALAAAMGANKVPGKGSGKVDQVPAVLAPGEAVVNKAGIKHIPGGRKTIAKANAKGAKEMGLSGHGKGKAAPPPQARQHFAAGTTSVPAPGQTVTSGSWSGPTGPSTPPPAPLPSSPTLGTDLRARLFGSK